MSQEKIQQLQMTEQSLQQLLQQKQNFQMQLMETDSALLELDSTDEAYKIVGNVMVAASNEDLKKELASKKETLELRVKTLDQQEERIRSKAADLQKEILEGMKDVDKDGGSKDN